MTVKRTFSLPDEVSAALDRVSGGNASAYVAETITQRLDREDYLAQLRAIPGWPTPETHPEEFVWALRALGASHEREPKAS